MTITTNSGESLRSEAFPRVQNPHVKEPITCRRAAPA